MLTILALLTSCDKQLDFDSTKWKEHGDLDQYPFRESMLRDVLENKKFIGQKYKLVCDSLGQPELWTDKRENELWYSVTVDYGSDIDPVYTKHLVLTMDIDSTITNAEIREWDNKRDY
jgi:KaiC/GvpD/RAD55 family RecA-like ATPase